MQLVVISLFIALGLTATVQIDYGGLNKLGVESSKTARQALLAPNVETDVDVTRGRLSTDIEKASAPKKNLKECLETRSDPLDKKVGQVQAKNCLDKLEEFVKKVYAPYLKEASQVRVDGFIKKSVKRIKGLGLGAMIFGCCCCGSCPCIRASKKRKAAANKVEEGGVIFEGNSPKPAETPVRVHLK